MKYLGVRSNILLNGLRIILGSAIGLVTMPYINKTIGVNGIGKVEYVYTVINYFILFSAFGIPTYGIREISKIKENTEKKSKLILELTTILFLTTTLSYLVLAVMLYNFKPLYDLKYLVIIMSSMILFSNMGMEWFYQAIEEQLFITLRFVFFTVFSFILLFTLVTGSDDYLYYAITLVFTSAGSSLTNIFFLRKHIDLTNIQFRTIELRKHLVPLVVIFFAQFLVSIYVQFDNILLGSLAGLDSVGYYSVANKLIRFVISFITIIGVILVPRLTFLMQEDLNAYLKYLSSSLEIILMVSMPIFILVLTFSREIIFLMAGEEFSEAVLLIKILSPLCVIVGVAYFLGYMVLIPRGLEKKYTVAVGLTALFSVTLNLIFVTHFKHVATAIIAVCSEFFCVLVILVTASKELKNINLINTSIVKITIASLVLSFVGFIFLQLPLNNLPKLISATVVGLCSYFGILIVLREKNILKECANLNSRLFKNE